MPSDHDAMLEELLQDESDAMTAWEVEFIESLNKQRGKVLSDKQAIVVERIWEKVFA